MGDFAHLDVGDHRLPCPQCDKGKRDQALGVTVTLEGGVWHCFRCEWSGSWRGQKPAKRLPAASVRQEKHLRLTSHYAAFWRDLQPIAGTGEQYLTARQCALPPSDGHLRGLETLRHPTGHVGPALVALVTDAITRAPLTLHRTWIRADGNKADVDPPRLLLGKHRKQGGVIRLWPDEAVTTGLAIAEGIETALSVARAFTPVWSTIDAGNMAAFSVLDGIESLLIVADNDAAGIRAAEQCAERWYRAGREVRIAKSPVPGEDLNDYARRAA